MICIAICDDEKYICNTIQTMLSNFFCKKNMEITIQQFSSGTELLQYNKTIDILFLDIQMDFIIFITILKEMVFQSFEVQAYDYLLKPITEKQFDKTMERLFTSIQNANEANLLIQKGHESRIISFEDIVYCEIIDRKVYLHLSSSEILDFYDRIENLEKKLDNNFFRCHRSFLINLKHLKSYKNGIAYMENGQEIPVSRLRSKTFSNVILQYMKSISIH